MQQEGWVKIHRKIMANDLLRYDNSAYIVFTKLWIYCDRSTGIYTTGRIGLAGITNLKPTTAYNALRRLEKQSMITLSSNSRFTKIQICNWRKYQSLDDSKQTEDRQKNDTKQEEEGEYNLVQSQRDVDIAKVYESFIQASGRNSKTYKLTAKRKTKIKSRLNDAGLDVILRALKNISVDSWANGDNNRGWKWDLDYLVRSYENVEKWANQEVKQGGQGGMFKY